MTPTRTLIDTHMTARRDRDVPALLATFAPDATWWRGGALPVSRTYRGADAIVNELFPALTALFRPGSVTLTTNAVTTTDDTAVVEWSVTATTLAGNPYNNDYAAIFEVRDGRITAVREYLDTAPLQPLFAAAAA